MVPILMFSLRRMLLTEESTDGGIDVIIEGFEDVVLSNRKSILPYH